MNLSRGHLTEVVALAPATWVLFSSTFGWNSLRSLGTNTRCDVRHVGQPAGAFQRGSLRLSNLCTHLVDAARIGWHGFALAQRGTWERVVLCATAVQDSGYKRLGRGPCRSCYWFWGIDLVPRDFISAKGLVAWILLVLVPSSLAVRHLYVLLWTH